MAAHIPKVKGMDGMPGSNNFSGLDPEPNAVLHVEDLSLQWSEEEEKRVVRKSVTTIFGQCEMLTFIP